jgi:hypothetical protein
MADDGKPGSGMIKKLEYRDQTPILPIFSTYDMQFLLKGGALR